MLDTVASGTGESMCIGLAACARPWPSIAKIKITDAPIASLPKLDAVRVATATNCHRDRSPIQKAPPSGLNLRWLSGNALGTEILSFDFSTKTLESKSYTVGAVDFNSFKKEKRKSVAELTLKKIVRAVDRATHRRVERSVCENVTAQIAVSQSHHPVTQIFRVDRRPPCDDRFQPAAETASVRRSENPGSPDQQSWSRPA